MAGTGEDRACELTVRCKLEIPEAARELADTDEDRNVGRRRVVDQVADLLEGDTQDR